MSNSIIKKYNISDLDLYDMIVYNIFIARIKDGDKNYLNSSEYKLTMRDYDVIVNKYKIEINDKIELSKELTEIPSEKIEQLKEKYRSGNLTLGQQGYKNISDKTSENINIEVLPHGIMLIILGVIGIISMFLTWETFSNVTLNGIGSIDGILSLVAYLSFIIVLFIPFGKGSKLNFPTIQLVLMGILGGFVLKAPLQRFIRFHSSRSSSKYSRADYESMGLIYPEYGLNFGLFLSFFVGLLIIIEVITIHRINRRNLLNISFFKNWL